MLKERSALLSHFNDLRALLGEPTSTASDNRAGVLILIVHS